MRVKIARIAVVSLLLVMVGGVITVHAQRQHNRTVGMPTEPSAEPYTGQDLIAATNRLRAGKSLPMLLENTQLDASAAAKCADEVKLGYFEHNRPDGTEPWIFFTQAGYAYHYAGENLAEGYNSEASVINAWKASPKHYANIMNPGYTETGIAICNNNDTTLIVQHFGSR